MCNFKIWSFISSSAPRYLLRTAMIEMVLESQKFPLDDVLEVGPGAGDFAAYIASFPEVQKLKLLESSEPAQKTLLHRFDSIPNVELIADLSHIPDRSLSSIFLFEVLEHVEGDEELLRDLLMKLKVGGRLVLSVPAYMKKWQHQDVWAGHVRRYESPELRALLAKVGVEVEVFYDFGFPIMNFLLPIKQVFYYLKNRSGEITTNQERTAVSGIDRSKKISVFSSMLKPILWLGAWFQYLFRYKRIGDGFVVVGRYRG